MHFGQIFAQSAFYYQHNTGNHNKPLDILELEDSYVVCGQVDSIGSVIDGFLLMMDKQGNVLWEKEFETNKTVSYRTMVDVNNGFVIGGFRLVNNKRRNLLKKFDYQGNQLWEKLIGDTLVLGGDNICSDLLYDKGNIFMATSGFDTNSNTTNAFLIKMDAEGNIIWQKNYGVDDYEQRVDRFKTIEVTEDGFVLYIESQNMSFKSFPHLVKVDFDGNEIWRKNLNYYQSTTAVSDTIIYYKNFTVANNNHVLVYLNREEPITYNSSHIIIEFDNFGNEINFTETQYTEGIAYADIRINKANEIFIIGYQDYDTIGAFLAEMFIAKFNCNNELLWENHYGKKNDTEFFTKGQLTSDGGILIVGWTFNADSPPARYNTIVVKTDCNGELEWNSESCVNPNHNETIVFPNPFTDYFNIHLPNISKKDKLEIQIYDLKGSLVDNYFFNNLNVIKLNTIKYSKGFYIIKIIVNDSEYETKKLIKY
jgi:hypothetical protein